MRDMTLPRTQHIISILGWSVITGHPIPCLDSISNEIIEIIALIKCLFRGYYSPIYLTAMPIIWLAQLNKVVATPYLVEPPQLFSDCC